MELKVPTSPNTHNVKLGFSWLFMVCLFADHRIDEQRLQLGEAFQHLAVAPGDLHDLRQKCEALAFFGAVNPENDRKAIYVVMICNVCIYI